MRINEFILNFVFNAAWQIAAIFVIATLVSSYVVGCRDGCESSCAVINDDTLCAGGHLEFPDRRISDSHANERNSDS
jgi:hypothetical protein